MAEGAPFLLINDIVSRRVVSFRQPLLWHVPPTDSSSASCDLRLLPKISLNIGSPTYVLVRPLYEIYKLTIYSALFPYPPDLTITLFIVLLFQDFEDSVGASSHGAPRGRARSWDWTRGTILPTHSTPWVDTSVTLAQPLFPSGLNCQRISSLF